MFDVEFLCLRVELGGVELVATRCRDVIEYLDIVFGNYGSKKSLSAY